MQKNLQGFRRSFGAKSAFYDIEMEILKEKRALFIILKNCLQIDIFFVSTFR